MKVERARKDSYPNFSDVLEKALKIYRDYLESPAGEIARRYLVQRNLPKEWWPYFEIGWLHQRGLPVAPLQGWVYHLRLPLSGLVVEGPRGIYDRFRGRIIFP